MQAIQTKYLGPTNFKGGRIKASCERGSITISYPDEISGQLEVHAYAAKMLCEKFCKEDEKKYGPSAKRQWSGEFVSGGLPDGTYAHVFLPINEIDNSQYPVTTTKQYACKKCGYLKPQVTNHYGETYSFSNFNTCPKCPPYTRPNVWVCLETNPNNK